MLVSQYDPDTIKAIQRAVGAKPDGIWGPATVALVARWHANHNTKRLSYAEWCALWQGEGEAAPAPVPGPAPAAMRFGLWWDIGAGHTAKRAAKYAARLAALGINNIAIMLNSSKQSSSGACVWKWSAERLRVFALALEAAGLTVGYSFWARPTPRYLDTLRTGLEERIAAHRPRRLEPDLEGKWRAKYVRDFPSLRDAGSSLLCGLRSYPCPVEVTSYPLHGEYGDHPSVADRADIWCPQAYGYWRRGKPDHAWDGRFGPGGMQRLTADRVKGSDRELVFGFACFGQTFPGHSPGEAMMRSYRATLALDLEIEEYRGWGAKHVVGPKANHYAIEAISAMTGGSII
jgi:hypothetical protein